MHLLYLIHRDDALHAAWEAFLAGVPMSWLVTQEHAS